MSARGKETGEQADVAAGTVSVVAAVYGIQCFSSVAVDALFLSFPTEAVVGLKLSGAQIIPQFALLTN